MVCGDALGRGVDGGAAEPADHRRHGDGRQCLTLTPASHCAAVLQFSDVTGPLCSGYMCGGCERCRYCHG